MQKYIDRFIVDESGATALEYSLIAAAIGLVIVTAVAAIGQDVKGVFEQAAAGFPD